jgi:hypothetical protein
MIILFIIIIINFNENYKKNNFNICLKGWTVDDTVDKKKDTENKKNNSFKEYMNKVKMIQ